ncbi:MULTISPECIES: hypothetical protein [Pseudofrankia]|uniref:hypothetical protein n=1 Tax=Pseudofrankia TaxID=2994363 RepID=UPI000234B198|nr:MULTISPECIES: hypothetical protein [Pseudofrankia]OHV40839.1 hypothetical protein BCD49_39295 [Pseudofrankia sp. EUN1h]
MTTETGDSSALDTAEKSFLCLTETPPGLSLDGRAVHAALPQRQVGLRELRVLLSQPALPVRARDAVWNAVLSERDEPAWLIGAAGLAVAPLRHIAAVLTTPAVERADTEGEVLTGFVAQARRTSLPTREAPLLWAGLRAGLALAAQDAAQLGFGVWLPVVAAIPPSPWWPGPRRVLDQAQRAGLVTEVEQRLLVETRLEGRSLAGVDPDAAEELAVWRAKAESRLAQAIIEGRFAPKGLLR